MDQICCDVKISASFIGESSGSYCILEWIGVQILFFFVKYSICLVRSVGSNDNYNNTVPIIDGWGDQIHA